MGSVRCVNQRKARTVRTYDEYSHENVGWVTTQLTCPHDRMIGVADFCVEKILTGLREQTSSKSRFG